MKQLAIGDYVAYDNVFGRTIVQVLGFEIDGDYNTYIHVRTLGGKEYYVSEDKLTFYF